MYVCMYVYMYVCMYVSKYARMNICMCVFMHVCVYNMYVWMTSPSSLVSHPCVLNFVNFNTINFYLTNVLYNNRVAKILNFYCYNN